MSKWLLRIQDELTHSHLEHAERAGPAHASWGGGSPVAPTLLPASLVGCPEHALVRRDPGKAQSAGLFNRQDKELTTPGHPLGMPLPLCVSSTHLWSLTGVRVKRGPQPSPTHEVVTTGHYSRKARASEEALEGGHSQD